MIHQSNMKNGFQYTGLHPLQHVIRGKFWSHIETQYQTTHPKPVI